MGTYEQSVPACTGTTYDQNYYAAAYAQGFNPAMQYLPRLNAIPTPKTPSKKRSLQEQEGESAPGPAKRPAIAAPSDIIYRLLVPSSKIGRVIGKQGARIRELRETSGAQIKIADPLSKGEERVITISSKEVEGELFSAAELLLIRVASLVVDEEVSSLIVPIGPQVQPQIALNLIRIVIGRSQAGCLIGKEGSIIKEIREKSGALVRVMPPEQMPFSSSISESDRLVQISGELPQVLEALKLVAKKLRENPPKELVTLKPTYHQQLMRYAQAAYRGQYNANNGLPVLSGGLDYQSGVAAATAISMLPKVTSEMNIPSALMGGVIGRGGVNITHVRSLSGCTVKVHNQEDGRTDRRITFEGTAEQVSAAQSLVQAFMNAQ
ncbi:hypothetical protein KP509_01G089600 [Ceratopteris richardii]|uniref:K Homology domain-containing protein n=1 Tax=Ceratopteris richardii TaxID=49495 RepID=A0A8T2VNC5_CERRI|nr:hypothetical protein KP509_01G089600 [Ceratopteris richardii]